MEKNIQFSEFGIAEKSKEHINRFPKTSNFSKNLKNGENSRKTEIRGDKSK